MKTIGKLTSVTLFLLFFTTQVFAQNSNAAGTTKDLQKEQVTTSVTPGNFVDKDNNGICDNFEARNASGRGANCIDKDGDGICDHRQVAGQGKANNGNFGKGNKHRNGNGKGCCGRGSGNCRQQRSQSQSK